MSGILGNVVGSVFGRNPRGSATNSLGEILGDIGGGAPIQSGMLLAAALTLLKQNGGLDGVLGQLRQNGFGAQADSWVGGGPNLPITPAQLQHSLGHFGLDHAAAPLNMSSVEAGSAMAEILPELVNQLTPEGHLPPNHADLVGKALTMLKSAGA